MLIGEADRQTGDLGQPGPPGPRPRCHLALPAAGVNGQADDEPLDLVLFHQFAVMAGILIGVAADVDFQRRSDRPTGVAHGPANAPQPEIEVRIRPINSIASPFPGRVARLSLSYERTPAIIQRFPKAPRHPGDEPQMKQIRISHVTEYHYHEPVSFGPHRALLRPREGHELHIERSRLEIEPRAIVRWLRDIYGNSIAIITFAEAARKLRLESEIDVILYDDAPIDSPSIRSNHPTRFSTTRPSRWKLSLTAFPAILTTARPCRNGSCSFTGPVSSSRRTNC